MAIEEPNESKIIRSDWLPEPIPDQRLIRRLTRLRWEKPVGAAVGIAVCGVFCYALFNGNSWLVGMWYAVFIIGLGAWRYASTRRAAPAVLDLVDLPAVVAQYPVEIDFQSSGVTYGRDVGIISFVDGWVHYQGRRTSFSVHRGAVGDGIAARVGRSGSRSGAAEIVYRLDSNQSKLRIVAMDSLEGLGAGWRTSSTAS